MGGKKAGTTAPTWDEFVEVTPMVDGVPRTDVLQEGETMWQNKFYVVFRHYLIPHQGHDGPIHLSIRHRDRKAIRDWRHFQRIKNELAGKQREAIEIFPPEALLVDGANQYHLWVLSMGDTTPFTWKSGRAVSGEEGGQEMEKKMRDMGFDPEQTVQRPIEEG
jgi:hypothetical protein